MFQSYPRKRRTSQSPAFFNTFDQSPYASCYPDFGVGDHPMFSSPSYQQQFGFPYDSGREFPPFNQMPSREPLQPRQPPHPLQLQREKELESRRQRMRKEQEEYQDTLRTERARRLAEAQRRQRPSPHYQTQLDGNTQVEVDLPDGRTCVVPLSWAKKMQARHPGYLTDSMIRPLRHRSPSPPAEHDQAIVDGDQVETDYVLDPTQDPIIDKLPSPTPSFTKRQSTPEVPPWRLQNPPQEYHTAAQLIQRQFRLKQRLNNLIKLESKYQELISSFKYPSPLDLKFIQPPTRPDMDCPSTLALEFNHPPNSLVQAQEEKLLQLQIQLDAIVSGGVEQIKARRKVLVKSVDEELAKLDRFKTEAWKAQQDELSRRKSDLQECPSVEMADACNISKES